MYSAYLLSSAASSIKYLETSEMTKIYTMGRIGTDVVVG